MKKSSEHREPSLVERITDNLQTRIESGKLRAGVRLPSIRNYAAELGVSRHSVVEAYERLIAKGLLESRRASGFFVTGPLPDSALPGRVKAAPSHWPYWRELYEKHTEHAPGSALFPGDLLDAERLGRVMREVTRQDAHWALGYGTAQGYLPLRQQLVRELADIDVMATDAQILTTHGIQHAVDLIARTYLVRGDAVLVEEPAWSGFFACFEGLGLRILTVPRQSDGPDLAVLRDHLETHRPKLYFINSVAQNPTGTSLSSTKAHQILMLAEMYDLLLVEDDAYGALASPRAARLAVLDQLDRVIYLSGFSKTIGANLRVGFIACADSRIADLTRAKMTTTLTCSEFSERVIHHFLSEGHYRKHMVRLRHHVDVARSETIQHIERLGLKLPHAVSDGLFFWVDLGCDTDALSEQALADGFVLSPGSYFSSTHEPSPCMRINVINFARSGFADWLERHRGKR
jgi:DNA-binding transcriptional MocR family regulator